MRHIWTMTLWMSHVNKIDLAPFASNFLLYLWRIAKVFFRVSRAAAILAIKPGVFNKLFYSPQIFLNDYLTYMIFRMAVLRPPALLSVIITHTPPLLSRLDTATLTLFFKKNQRIKKAPGRTNAWLTSIFLAQSTISKLYIFFGLHTSDFLTATLPQPSHT